MLYKSCVICSYYGNFAQVYSWYLENWNSPTGSDQGTSKGFYRTPTARVISRSEPSKNLAFMVFAWWKRSHMLWKTRWESLQIICGLKQNELLSVRQWNLHFRLISFIMPTISFFKISCSMSSENTYCSMLLIRNIHLH